MGTTASGASDAATSQVKAAAPVLTVSSGSSTAISTSTTSLAISSVKIEPRDDSTCTVATSTTATEAVPSTSETAAGLPKSADVSGTVAVLEKLKEPAEQTVVSAESTKSTSSQGKDSTIPATGEVSLTDKSRDAAVLQQGGDQLQTDDS